MKNTIKKFIKRGASFSCLGPLTYAIVILIIHLCNVDTSSDGLVIFKAIISTALLAFICAGASVVWEEEKLGLGFASLIHGTALYISYLIMYLVNNWIPRNLESLLIFSALFVGTYVIIWLIIFITEKNRAKKFNSKLKINK